MNLEEFKNWALKEEQVGNPTKENSYKGQCVSLVQQYLTKVHNMPFKARGNAKDWANNIPEGFKKVTGAIKEGDILVYAGTKSNEHGHIAIVIANNKLLEQNYSKKLNVSISDVRSNYIAILRSEKIITKKYTSLMELQAILGTVQDDIYGPITKRLVNNASIRKGCSNSKLVIFVQKKLKEKGYSIVVDGVFQNQTLSVVKRFQKDKKLLEDGWVGEQTMGKLLNK